MSLIRYVTRIHFADRAMEDALPEEMRVRNLAAPLIFSDVDAGEALPRLLDCLPPGTRPRVVGINAEGIGGAAQLETSLPEDAGECDLVIGLGGSHAIDMARVFRLPSAATRPVARLPSQLRSVPRMAVPTLPGCTGLGPIHPKPLAKGLRGASKLPSTPVPSVLFCDPSLLQFAEPARLAVAGFDALVDCLEALLSTAWNPPADGMAFDGLRRAGQWLERMVADPADPEARCEVMAAALNGALAAQKGFGAIHALAHALESLAGSTDRHGGLHAALIGPALAFNAPAVPDRIARAADALRLTGSAALAPHLQEIGARLRLPVRLGHLGLTATGISRLAEAAAEDCANSTNPRHATSGDYRLMIEAAV